MSASDSPQEQYLLNISRKKGATIIIDDFTLNQVTHKGEKCHASECKNICNFLKSQESQPDSDGNIRETKYLPICVPCYNEEQFDLIKLFKTLLENISFAKSKVSSSHWTCIDV